MYCPQSACRRTRWDDHRYIAFGRTLRNRAYVNPSTAERAKYFGGNTGHTRHAITDHSENGELWITLDRLDLAILQFAIKSAF
jgi:hypothetical protein